LSICIANAVEYIANVQVVWKTVVGFLSHDKHGTRDFSTNIVHGGSSEGFFEHNRWSILLGSNGCDGFTCPAGKSCQLDADNRPGCVCNEICYLVYSPVCGSDGKTYSNDCFLGVQACKTNTVITIQHPGSCDDSKLVISYACTELEN